MRMANANSYRTFAPPETESLLCSICLEIFKTPKILPCFHTFCEGCLQDLTRNGAVDRFPCPSCREEIIVPPGGVSAFRSNFYIQEEDIERARFNIICAKHPKKAIELYCVQCSAPLCVTCFVLEHKHHKTEDITAAKAKLRVHLEKGKPRLNRCVERMKADAEKAEQELPAVKAKKAAVKEAILNRHATVQAAIDKYRDEALASLDIVTDDILAFQETILVSQHEMILQQLVKLQKQLQQALDSDNISQLVAVSTELNCGRGSEEAVPTKHTAIACRPVLRFCSSTDVMLQSARDYLGTVAKMEMAVSAPEVTVVEQFRCRDDPDTDVCHACPMTDDHVWGSYEQYVSRNQFSAEKFDSHGNVVSKNDRHDRGRVTMVRRKEGRNMYPKSPSGYFAKKCDPNLDRFLLLEARGQGLQL